VARTGGDGVGRAAALEAEVADLRRQLAEAKAGSAHKSRFIRHVSHEFRTPLSSIIGFASLLEREADSLSAAERAEYLAVVLRNGRHLLHVVNDLLNISKVEAGALEVTLAPLRPAETAAAVITSVAPLAEARGVTIDAEDTSTRLAMADSGRLRQVLFNLLENAVKYSPPGSRIHLRVRDAGDEVRVEVRDPGPGISAEDQARLFIEFSRVNPPGLRVSGAGLGLALSRMLTEAMGGRIGVRSAPGKGSTFWIALRPAAPGDRAVARASRSAVAARGRGQTLAVVDDDADIRAYAAAVLGRAGYRVVVDDGTPGAGARLADARPALVLMDLHLRGRTGAEVLAELRAHDALAGVTVLAFTADAPADPDPPGFMGRIAKPAEPDVLAAAVHAALPGAPAPPAGEEGEADFLAPLRERFRAGLPGRLAKLERAARAGDREALLRELHKLRGAAAGYGFDGLALLGDAAEHALRAGDGGAELDALMARLRAEVPAR
jgi:nitrogen-specific signal transduction histidine kinase/CheY-like chemotaxis protein